MYNDAVIICIAHLDASADTGMFRYEMLKLVLSEGFIYKKIQMNLEAAFTSSCDRIPVIIHNTSPLIRITIYYLISNVPFLLPCQYIQCILVLLPVLRL